MIFQIFSTLNQVGTADPDPMVIFGSLKYFMGFAIISMIVYWVWYCFHFLSIFCIFYCIYFVAKTIKTVELQRAVKFKDFVGEFFLVWFFPIGVWILQPTINKLEGGMDYDEFDNIL
jgi:hypothetical protein